MADSEQILRWLIETDDLDSDADWKDLQPEPQQMFLVNGRTEAQREASSGLYQSGRFQFIEGEFSGTWYRVYAIRYLGRTYINPQEFRLFEEEAKRFGGDVFIRVGEIGAFRATYDITFRSSD